METYPFPVKSLISKQITFAINIYTITIHIMNESFHAFPYFVNQPVKLHTNTHGRVSLVLLKNPTQTSDSR
jgi:hypothetical protein